MSPAADPVIALEAFLGEHRRCWRLHGKDMDTCHDDAFLWIDCYQCGSAVLVSLS